MAINNLSSELVADRRTKKANELRDELTKQIQDETIKDVSSETGMDIADFQMAIETKRRPHPFTFNPIIAHAQYYISLTHSDPPQKLSFQAVPSLHKKRPRSVREYPSPTDQSPSRSQHLQLLSPTPSIHCDDKTPSSHIPSTGSSTPTTTKPLDFDHGACRQTIVRRQRDDST